MEDEDDLTQRRKSAKKKGGVKEMKGRAETPRDPYEEGNQVVDERLGVASSELVGRVPVLLTHKGASSNRQNELSAHCRGAGRQNFAK